jgi:hypothetical protein
MISHLSQYHLQLQSLLSDHLIRSKTVEDRLSAKQKTNHHRDDRGLVVDTEEDLVVHQDDTIEDHQDQVVDHLMDDIRDKELIEIKIKVSIN